MIGTGSEHRSVLTEAVRPPRGHVFADGVVTTYSLSLPTLLSLPAHVVLGDPASRAKLLENPVALLDAVRRARGRLAVFVDAGRIAAPRREHLLFGLLEPMIHEVSAPRGGAFHPKVWALRFRPAGGVGPDLIRLLILSRNLTEDRSWDLSLCLEGAVGPRARRTNAPMRGLLRWLAKQVAGSPGLQTRVEDLADALGTVEWQVPHPFQSVDLVVLGLRPGRWLPTWERGRSRSLVVVSPFVDARALTALGRTTEQLVALVSRPESLSPLPAGALAPVGEVLTLAEHAASEDGEDTDDSIAELSGLHAKAFLSRRSWYVEVAVGSANATAPALLDGRNVEVLAVLRGKASVCGEPRSLLDEQDGIGELLEPWEAPLEPPEPDAAALTQAMLDRARTALGRTPLRLRCERAKDGWRLVLRAGEPFALEGVAILRAWPVTLSADHAVPADSLLAGDDVRLPVLSTALLTGLVAFEIAPAMAPPIARMVRSIPLEGLPDDHYASVVEAVLEGRDGFLRYLRYLLGDLASDEVTDSGAGAPGAWGTMAGLLGADSLLEPLTRALAREPRRLAPIRDLVDHLRASREGHRLLPPEFESLWAAFEPMVPAAAPDEADAP